MTASILVVEDEEPIQILLSYNLEAEGYRVRHTDQGEDVQRLIGEERPDLIVLDWMLPGISGIEVCRLLRARPETRDIPIIMLTARAEEDDKVKGLQEADDYITKPFSTRELKARILAVLRRVTPGGQQDLIQVNGLCLDPVGHKVTVQGELLDMGPTEFRLLHFFMTHPERVYTREQLLNNVWGQNVYVEERTVDVHIRRLRKALAVSGHDRHVQTVRTVGYRFSTQV